MTHPLDRHLRPFTTSGALLSPFPQFGVVYASFDCALLCTAVVHYHVHSYEHFLWSNWACWFRLFMCVFMPLPTTASGGIVFTGYPYVNIYFMWHSISLLHHHHVHVADEGRSIILTSWRWPLTFLLKSAGEPLESCQTRASHLSLGSRDDVSSCKE